MSKYEESLEKRNEWLERELQVSYKNYKKLENNKRFNNYLIIYHTINDQLIGSFYSDLEKLKKHMEERIEHEKRVDSCILGYEYRSYLMVYYPQMDFTDSWLSFYHDKNGNSMDENEFRSYLCNERKIFIKDD